MKTYFRILKRVKPYINKLSASVFFTILYALMNGLSVYLAIPLLDTLFNSSNKQNENILNETVEKGKSIFPEWLLSIKDNIIQTFNEFVFSGDSLEALIKICTIILFTFFAKNIFGYLQSFFIAFVEKGLVRDIRNEIYEHLHKLPMSYFNNERTGNLMSRIINDVEVIQTGISAVFFNLIREPLTIIVFLGIAISISWQLTLVSFIVLPVSLALISWLGFKLKRQNKILQEKIADITNLLHETITSIKIVKAFAMEEYENSKFRKETESYFRQIVKIVHTRNIVSPLTEFLSIIVGVVIIFYGGKLVLETNTIKASEFLGFLFAIFQLMTPIKELSNINNRIQETSAAGERIFEVIDTPPIIKNDKDPVALKVFDKEVTFENVHFKYSEEGDYVLKKINFNVRKGEVIALVGSSGAGKTTLVDLLPRFYDPTQGRILIDGIDIKKIKLDGLRMLMGIVTQETVLFNESVKNNIAYGLEEYPTAKIIEAAKTANAHKFISDLPLGYDTIIGERGTKLSGGQRQRLSIARALLKNPPIMIFDEATSALDNESEVLVQEAIERLMHDRTTFVIAHRLSTIRNADRILVLEEGRIIQSGKHEELILDNTGEYKKLYELQFRDK